MGDGALSRAWRRLVSSSQGDVENAERQTFLAEADRVRTCADRQRVRLRGVITSVALSPPRQGAPWLQAVFSDGSGEVNLIWMGRHSIPGVVAGTRIAVEGRIVCADGERRIFNPKYELIAQ